MSSAPETAASARGRALVAVAAAQRGDGLLRDGQVVHLVLALLAAVEDHRRLGEVQVGEGGLGLLRGDDAWHDVARDAIVGVLQARDVAHVDGDDRGREDEDGAEAEAELDGQAHVPKVGACGGERGDA